jgi:hypothetical protein
MPNGIPAFNNRLWKMILSIQRSAYCSCSCKGVCKFRPLEISVYKFKYSCPLMRWMADS